MCSRQMTWLRCSSAPASMRSWSREEPRATRGVFRQARALLDRGEVVAPPTPIERIEMAREHGKRLVEFAGEHSISRMRKHVTWYMAEMPGATFMRTKTNRMRTSTELDALLVEYREYLEAREATELAPASPLNAPIRTGTASRLWAAGLSG